MHHLKLTPAESRERAKVCARCSFVKEIRDYARDLISGRDGIRIYCRACMNKLDTKRQPRLSAEKALCGKCNMEKPAADFYPSKLNVTGLHSYCKCCALQMRKESLKRVHEAGIYLRVEAKRCSKCGEVKSAASFCRKRGMYDGIHSLCKACDGARRARR